MPADNMVGLRMFKGSENYSFEMDESCTCQVYQSCTLYISFPLASMHNFPSMQISTHWKSWAYLLRCLNTFSDTENGSSLLNRDQNNAILFAEVWGSHFLCRKIKSQDSVEYKQWLSFEIMPESKKRQCLVALLIRMTYMEMNLPVI